MLPHFHISGMHALVIFLMVFAMFGALHLVTSQNPDNRLSKAVALLGF